MRQIALLLASALGLGGAGLALAQTVEGLDLKAIQARAAEQSAEVEAFVQHVKGRGDALKAVAQDAADAGNANLERVAAKTKGDPAAAIDLDQMVADAGGAMRAEQGQAPQLIVFVSLSMPADSLKPLLRDVSRAGGVVVFQGFPNNSVKAFGEALSKAIDDKSAYRSIGIDPRLFRAFDVDVAPTIVVVSSDFDLCDGFDCRTKVPPHDRMSGNVTLTYALETIATGGGPGAGVAAAALANLKRNAS